MANVLAVQGPGAKYAHARAEGMDLADLTKPDEHNKWLAFINLNRRQMLELLADDEDCIVEQLEAAKRHGGIGKTLLSWLLLCLLVPVSVLFYRSSRVFTPVTDNIILQTRDGFFRDGVWIKAKIALAIALGTHLLAYVACLSATF